jgi:hypothetical protein
MSDTTGSRPATGRTPHPGDALPTAGRPGRSAVLEADSTEAYAFACMHCGHGWEQAYVIEHHADASGRTYVTYLAEGVQVPSPLTRPSCGNCGGHLVRITRAGQVASVARRKAVHHEGRRHWHGRQHRGDEGGAPAAAERERWNWNLLRLFRRRHASPPSHPDGRHASAV